MKSEVRAMARAERLLSSLREMPAARRARVIDHVLAWILEVETDEARAESARAAALVRQQRKRERDRSRDSGVTRPVTEGVTQSVTDAQRASLSYISPDPNSSLIPEPCSSLRQGSRTETGGRESAPVSERKLNKKGTRLDPNFAPSRDGIRWALEEEGLPAELVERETKKFVDHWVGVPGARGLRLDWEATWRNWIRKVPEFSKSRLAPSRAQAAMDAQLARVAKLRALDGGG